MALTKINNNTLSAITGLPAGVGGKVLQVVNDIDTAAIVLNTTNWIDTALSINFTPVSASSNLLLVATIQGFTQGNSSNYGEFQARFNSDGSAIGESYERITGNIDNNRIAIHEAYTYSVASNSTNSRIIKIQVKNNNTNQFYCAYNQYPGYSSFTIWEYLS